MSSEILDDKDHIPLISGLEEVVDKYDAFILDVFGVIHNGEKPFPGTMQALKKLKDSGKDVCLLTNSPLRASQVIQKCESMGIGREYTQNIVTSGESTRLAIQDYIEKYGPKCWHAGNNLAQRAFEGLGLEFMAGPASANFILNSIPGWDATDASAFLRELDEAVQLGLPMICANPDMVVHVGDILYTCAGTYAKYYEDHGGYVDYHGKPHEPVYAMALEQLGSPDKSKICAVGDSLHTDIQGANRFGIDSIMNLVGIHWEEVQLDHKPGEADIAKIQELVENQDHIPTYTMAGFAW